MLAEDEIKIEIGSGRNREIVFLRPTLRAAMRLDRAYGGFDKIIEAIVEENVTVMASVIRESEEPRSDIPRLVESLAGMPLYAGVERLKEPLIKHVLQLAGCNSTDADKSDAKAEPVTFQEHYTRLYRIATGWLGWTPEAAWTATPSEIIEAFKGRTEMLKAIFGGGEANDAQNDAEQPAEVFNGKLAAHLAMASARFGGKAA